MLKTRAAASQRSMNGEIIAILWGLAPPLLSEDQTGALALNQRSSE